MGFNLNFSKLIQYKTETNTKSEMNKKNTTKADICNNF